MPTHLQHDLHLQTAEAIRDTVSLTLNVGRVQEPHWRSIHRHLRDATAADFIQCQIIERPAQSHHHVTAILIVRTPDDNGAINEALTACYRAWLDSCSSPQFESAHEYAKHRFWDLMNSIVDHCVGPDHHHIQDSISLSRAIASLPAKPSSAPEP